MAVSSKVSEYSINLGVAGLKSIRSFFTETLSDRNGESVAVWCHDQLSGGAKVPNVQRLWYSWNAMGSPDINSATLEMAADRGGVKIDNKRVGATVRLSREIADSIMIFTSRRCSGNVPSVLEFISEYCKGALNPCRQGLFFSMEALKLPWKDIDEVSMGDLKEAAAHAGILYGG